MAESPKCLVCSQSRSKKIDSKDEYLLYRCKSCGFGYAWPRPKIEDLEKLYDEAFDENSENGRWSGELTEGNPKNKHSGMDTHTTDEKDYRERLDLIRRFLPDGGQSLLDVGCAAGFFVDYARRTGWDAHGLDVSAYNARMAKEFFDLEITLAPLTKSGLEEETFDAVLMRCILEHSVDPRGDLEEVRRLLKPDGVVYIYIPNEFNPIQNYVSKHVVKKRWWFAAPHHINFFTPDSLKIFLKDIGFKMEYLSTTFPVELFLLLGFDYVNHPEKGKIVGKTIDTINKLSDRHKIIEQARDGLYEQLINKFNIGRGIITVARKY